MASPRRAQDRLPVGAPARRLLPAQLHVPVSPAGQRLGRLVALRGVWSERVDAYWGSISARCSLLSLAPLAGSQELEHERGGVGCPAGHLEPKERADVRVGVRPDLSTRS